MNLEEIREPSTEMTLAKLISSKSHVLPGKLKVSELFFEVPLNWSNPAQGAIRLFARSVQRHEKTLVPLSPDEAAKKAQKPWFVYLQGGPGFGCSPPQHMGITDIVLDKGYQMLYLDQRGTGMSATITAETLKLRGGPEAQAEYLKNFRADSIVKDCEAVRKLLTEDYPDELKKWSLLGQSFGGFCAFTYLSKAPAGLREVFTSGGVPPIGKTAPQVYQATFQQVIKRNQAYYAKYPDDIPMVHDLAIYIRSQNGIALPAGGKLTVRRFLMLGMLFGGHGGVDTVHNLILRMHSDLRQFTFLSRPTLSALEGAVGYDDNVIYALLHESIYCDANGPSDWAAERVSKSLTEYQWVTLAPPSAQTVRETPLHFSGEMVYRWMFDVYPELHALKPVADILASYEGWGGLYDEWQLARNEVPVYAATYTEDMYVDFGLVQESIGKVKGVKQWVTSGCYHDAVRSKSGEVMRELFALRDDSID